MKKIRKKNITRSLSASLKSGAFYLLSALTVILSSTACANVNGKVFGGPTGPSDPTGPQPDPRCRMEAEASGFHDGTGSSKDEPWLICSYEQLALIVDEP